VRSKINRGTRARRWATAIAYSSPLVSFLAFCAWSQGWFAHFGWSTFTVSTDVEWFLMLASPVAGFLAGLLAITLAFRSGEGRIAAVLSVVVNLLFAFLVWNIGSHIAIG
jgi:hypothetical protein